MRRRLMVRRGWRRSTKRMEVDNKEDGGKQQGGWRLSTMRREVNNEEEGGHCKGCRLLLRMEAVDKDGVVNKDGD